MGVNRLYGLDALRGVAAIIVAIGHVFDIYGHYNPFEHSHIAVDFFFILSGYVMARTYEGRLGTEIGTVQFLVIRFRRLWPPLAVGALIGLLPLWIAGYPVWSTLVLLCLALLLLPAAWDFGTYPLNPPAWSITLELIANIFHAAFLWRVGTRSLFALAAAWALIALFPGNPVLTYLARVMLPYTIGILLWRQFGDRPRLPFWPAPFAIPVLALAYAWFAPGREDRSLIVPIVCLIWPPVLIAGLGLKADSRFAGLAAMAGALSFPLYAVHYPLIELVHGFGGPAWLSFVVALAGGLLVSVSLEQSVRRKQRAVPETTASPLP